MKNSILSHGLINRIKEQFPDKIIWLYSNFYLDEIITDSIQLKIIRFCDALWSGRSKTIKIYPKLKFIGSSNHSIIDMKRIL